MKILFKKLKRTNKIELTMYTLALLYYLVLFVVFTISILNLKRIETFVRITVLVFFGIWSLYYFIGGLVNLILKKHHKFVVLTTITIAFSLIFTFGSYYINIIYKTLDQFKEKEKIVYTTKLITLKDTNFDAKSKIGMIQRKSDIEGYILPHKLIEQKNIQNEIVTYNDYYAMIDALYDKSVDAIFLQGNYVTIYQNDEDYTTLSDDTKTVYKLSKEMKNQDLEIKSNKSLTEPFTLLIMGVDSEKDGLNANAAFNGDTLMLITFNPKTLNSTIFSIPRDTYVPIACRNNKEYKINSSAAYGTKCVIDTIEQLTDIKIDYYVKINFGGVINLVDSLGGVDVNVPKKFCESDRYRRTGKDYEICLDKGPQHLNGDQALALARHRHTLQRGDIDRTRNQQIVVEAIAKQLIKNISFSDFQNILESISANIASNIDRDQILSLYDTLKQMLLNSLNGEDIVTMQRTYMEYYDLPIYTATGYRSCVGYYPSSLEAIKDAMKVNLGTKKAVLNKSFSYDANIEYEEKIIGKGLRSGNTIDVLPDFTNQSVSDVINYGNEKELPIKVEYIDPSDSKYNKNITSGFVSSQSIRANTKLSTISELTIYVNK